MNMAKKFNKYTKDVINGYVYVEKVSYNLNLSMPYNIGIANLSRMWCST